MDKCATLNQSPTGQSCSSSIIYRRHEIRSTTGEQHYPHSYAKAQTCLSLLQNKHHSIRTAARCQVSWPHPQLLSQWKLVQAANKSSGQHSREHRTGVTQCLNVSAYTQRPFSSHWTIIHSVDLGTQPKIVPVNHQIYMVTAIHWVPIATVVNTFRAIYKILSTQSAFKSTNTIHI